MADTEITTPDGFTQQVGGINFNIGKFLPLNFALKNATERKLNEIFEILRNQPNLSDNQRDVLIHAIDLCKCKEEKLLRLDRFERIVLKSTHTSD